MLKKILISGFIVCILLVVSSSSVVAADKTLTDDESDVRDFISDEKVSISPNINVDNIDIIEMTYSKQGKDITLSLDVKGEIENRGDISDLYSESEEAIDAVQYTLYLYTSDDSYMIYYVNNKCKILYESTGVEENISDSDFSVEASTLTVSFDILNDDETYDFIEAMVLYTKQPDLSEVEDISDYEYLYDMIPDIALEVTADASSEGKIGESIDFSGDVSEGTSPYTWTWSFGDGETSDEQNPTHVYDEAGTYNVTLSVTDADGNHGSDSITLTISASEINGGNTNNNGNQGDSLDSGLVLFVALIAIISIVGVAVIVYIIRR